MIKSCSFGSVPDGGRCGDLMSSKNATTFFSAKYGYCYAFNYNPPTFTGENLTVTFPGPVMGLVLEMNIDSLYYMRNGLTPEGGARVVIHEPNGAPLLSSSGYDIHPNSITSIGLRLVNITRYSQINKKGSERLRNISLFVFFRQPPPYTSQCITYWNETSGLKNTYENLRYQAQLCQAMCVHDELYAHCGCSLPDIGK